MKQNRGALRWTIIMSGLLLAVIATGGCAREGSVRAEDDGRLVAPLESGPRAVVQDYLRAATRADGAAMYALIASSERDDETPKTLRETAADRYSPDTSWGIVKVEEQGSTAHVNVEVKGAKVEPNPYRFTLTREAGEWRIVQSPELHEDDQSDDIRIDLP